MVDKIADKYGEPRPVKYLVTSLDDLKDVVDTVNFTVSNNCKKDDLEQITNSIRVNMIPLQSSKSSFIISMNVPALLLEANPGEQTDEKARNQCK